MMRTNDLKYRTKEFAKNIIQVMDDLPNKRIGWTISDQVIRSSTSVAANYRAVCRAKSDKDFIHKMGTVAEEADETLFWIEMIDELKLIPDESQWYSSVASLKSEANELVSIFVASIKTVKTRINNS